MVRRNTIWHSPRRAPRLSWWLLVCTLMLSLPACGLRRQACCRPCTPHACCPPAPVAIATQPSAHRAPAAKTAEADSCAPSCGDGLLEHGQALEFCHTPAECSGLGGGFFDDSCELVRCDVKNYFAEPNLRLMGVSFGLALAMAQTPADEDIQTWYQTDVRNQSTDDLSAVVKPWGEGKYLVPVLCSAALFTALYDDAPAARAVGEWSDRSLRALLIGAPPMLLAQVLTGASRPTEAGSHWRPFHDHNGVSGHAFIGAVPLIAAAQMTEEPLFKAGLYFASTLPAWSRVNDNGHYTSQAALGWTMAYVACAAVDQTNAQWLGCQVSPMPVQDGMGLGLVYSH